MSLGFVVGISWSGRSRIVIDGFMASSMGAIAYFDVEATYVDDKRIPMLYEYGLDDGT